MSVIIISSFTCLSQ